MKEMTNILSWDCKTDGLVSINQQAFIDKGEQQCIKLTLLDGREITCTPNHKFLTNQNKWIEAKDIILNNTQLKMGIDNPKCDDIFDNYDYIFTQFLDNDKSTVYPCRKQFNIPGPSYPGPNQTTYHDIERPIINVGNMIGRRLFVQKDKFKSDISIESESVLHRLFGSRRRRRRR